MQEFFLGRYKFGFIEQEFLPLHPTRNPFENILAPLGGKFACGEVCEGFWTS